MISVAATLSKKYAQAFINIFGDELSVPFVERMNAAGAYFQHTRSSLFYGHIPASQETLKNEIMHALKQVEIDHLLVPLIELLLVHKHIALLPLIIKQIYVLYLQRENIIHFTIESMPALTDDESTKLLNYLEKKTGKKILYTLKTNPQLIAGLEVYSDTLGFEYSIRKQLNSLRQLSL